MVSIPTIKRRFAKVFNGVSRLVEDKHFFQEYQKYIQASTALPKDNEFLYFISLNYIEAATLGVYRQLDSHWKSQSLLKVLKEIDRNASVFTFKRFARKYKGPMMQHQAKVDFAQFATKDGSRIDRRKLKKDIVTLKRVTKPVVKYRHRVVAHQNRRQVSITATVNDLYAAVDLLEKLIIKYNLLLTQAGMASLLPGNTRPNLSGIFK